MAKWLLSIGALNVFNFFYTSNLYYTRQVVLVNLACLALVWIVAEIINPDRLKWLLWVMVGSCVAVCLEGLAQVFGHGVLIPWNQSGAPISTIGNTNYLGAFLLFGIFACLSLLPNRSSRYGLILLPPFLLAVTLLVLSRARASWLGAAVGGVVWAWMSFSRRTFILVAIGAVLAGFVAWTVMPAQWKNANTFGYRLKYWSAAIELWKDSPLIGIGFDGYRSKVYEAQARINDRQKNFFVDYIDPKPRRVHNEYLQALVDGGILYAGVYFGFIVWVLIHSYGAARTNPIILGVWCAQISILTAALFFFTFRLVDTAMLFHINLGVLCATSQSSS